MSTDRDALNELYRNTTPGRLHTITHYLYLPDKKTARSVAAKLRKSGLRTEDRLGADGVNWLVLAYQEAVPSESLLSRTRAELTELALAGGGEYDGWEAETITS